MTWCSARGGDLTREDRREIVASHAVSAIYGVNGAGVQVPAKGSLGHCAVTVLAFPACAKVREAPSLRATPVDARCRRPRMKPPGAAQSWRPGMPVGIRSV